MKDILISITLFFAFSFQLLGQQSVFKDSILVAELQEDYKILKEVLEEYHPGLYRYQDSTAIEKHFLDLENELNKSLSTTEFYLSLSRFTRKLKCGHTFCSYYNQPKIIQDSIFNQSDKVPFTFSLFEKQMVITKNLSGNNLLNKTQIISINEVPVSTIIDTLLTYVKGDGSNDGKRLKDLELTGLGTFEAFDIYFPLLYPPIDSVYKLEAQKTGSDESFTVEIKLISRSERLTRIEENYGKQASNYDELWSFEILDPKTAYLKLGTFVTYKMTLDWKKFLADAFEEIESKNIPNLIIDIRDNEGGDEEVNLVLANHLAKKTIELPEYKELLTYDVISDELKPYLKTWDKSFYDRTDKVIDLNNGFYTWKKENTSKKIAKNENAFSGDVFLLVNEANSSATFFLAHLLQQNKMATIIGTETGGNLKGTNGGSMFFLRLPNSKIEIDIPLIGYYPTVEQVDKGLAPDIMVKKTIEDLITEKDIELEKVFEIINK
ncbi:S41 family peptidase [Flagellimonas eckloniae]|uniref:S41 family peptidase n=1 Tax=Flagellimonas eckloniae TaxID=346185 RepID=UPI0009EBEC1C|nr:S41 family peptidase [Allomuricauda eckloniae]